MPRCTWPNPDEAIHIRIGLVESTFSPKPVEGGEMLCELVFPMQPVVVQATAEAAARDASARKVLQRRFARQNPKLGDNSALLPNSVP